MKKISVITVSLNRGYEIEKTVQSVLTQTYQNLEYWVIDGGSTDETHQLLQKYQNQLSFVSEKDNGIYHAMNKGIVKSNGDYLLFLNAGDSFYSDLSLQTLIDQSAYEDLVYGDMLMKEPTHTWTKTFPELLTFDFFLNDFLPHPATLIKRSLFSSIGLFNENNKIVSDWEFFTHAVCKCNTSYKHVNSISSVFNTDGISSLNVNLSLYEKEQVLKTHYSSFINDYADLHKCRTELQHIKNSRLHTITSKIMKSSLYRFLKK
ncbi:MAG: hypothetical protein JWN56_1420 [Sphingobacteriales bacterium]|nr:hypothetical protein [Sphingobacteriales bacterium]